MCDLQLITVRLTNSARCVWHAWWVGGRENVLKKHSPQRGRLLCHTISFTNWTIARVWMLQALGDRSFRTYLCSSSQVLQSIYAWAILNEAFIAIRALCLPNSPTFGLDSMSKQIGITTIWLHFINDMEMWWESDLTNWASPALNMFLLSLEAQTVY